MKMPEQIFIKNYNYIDHLIHSSQYTKVYRAHHIHNHTPTLLFKVYNKKEAWARVVKELNYLWHVKEKPHIVEILDEVEVNNQIFVITQYCEKGNLASEISKLSALPEQTAINYIEQIIQGYHTVFEHKIIHRNLTAENIFNDGLRLKIGDFSDAIGVKECKQASKKKQLVGNLRYQAPQVLDQCLFSLQSDIYSIGVIFYFMLTGKLPFQGANKTEILNKINSSTLSSIIPQTLSPQTKQFLSQTLQVNPSKRMNVQRMMNYQFDYKESLKIPKLLKMDSIDEAVSYIHHETRIHNQSSKDILEKVEDKQLFKMFNYSQNKISLIDIKFSDDEELSRFYRGHQISISIPNKLNTNHPVLNKKSSAFDDTRSKANILLLKSQHTQQNGSFSLNTKDNHNQSVNKQLFTKINVLTPQHQLLLETYKHSDARSFVEPQSILQASNNTQIVTSKKQSSQLGINDYNEGPATAKGWPSLKKEMIQNAKMAQILNWFISQIDMFRWLNRVSYKLNKVQRNEESQLCVYLIGLRHKILKEIIDLTHLERPLAEMFIGSSQYVKLIDIVMLYKDKLKESHRGRFQSYEQLNKLLVDKIRLLFQEIQGSSRLLEAETILLDYLVSLWQLCKLLKKNDLQIFSTKSCMEAILQSQEYGITVGHLLCIYEKLKKFKLIAH